MDIYLKLLENFITRRSLVQKCCYERQSKNNERKMSSQSEHDHKQLLQK